MIEYEKLKVYRTSLACVELVIKITENIPRSFSELRNQLHRAIFSVSLNIAEGAGRSERAEKIKSVCRTVVLQNANTREMEF